jgi:hypothetical protein
MPGKWPRLIYRTSGHRGRRGERRSFGERDYISLIDAAHQRLDGPIVLVRDNLNTHVSVTMRAMIDAGNGCTSSRRPARAPDLSPGRSGVGTPETQHRQPRRPRRRPAASDHQEPAQKRSIPHELLDGSSLTPA